MKFSRFSARVIGLVALALLALPPYSWTADAAGIATVTAQTTQPTGIISYVKDHDLVLRDLKTQQETKLTNLGDVASAQWAPDGQQVIYYEESASDSSVWLLNTQTKQKKQLPVEAAYGVFSTDSKWIAFVDGDNHLAKITISDLQVTRLTTGENSDINPAFGDDGSMYFIRRVVDKDGNFTDTLIMRRSAAGAISPVYDTHDPAGLCGLPGLAVFKSQWLAFSYSCGVHARSVSVVNIASGARRDATDYFNSQACEYLIGWAHKSPNLAVWDSTYCTDAPDADSSKQSLVVIPFGASKPQGATILSGEDDNGVVAPDWSPDDKWLLFERDNKQEDTQSIWIVSANGGKPQQIAASGADPQWLPISNNAHDFAETGYTVTDRFWDVWQGGRAYADSLYINGYPITDMHKEVSLTDGKVYQTQWFERARFEQHPENSSPNDVLLGLLGVQAAKGRENEAAFKRIAKPGAALQWFAATGHTLGDSSAGGQAIATFWNKLGGLQQFGYPISQPFMEKSKDDGKSYLVQYFERQRFEYHPENKGSNFEVLLGRLGAEQVGASGQ